MPAQNVKNSKGQIFINLNYVSSGTIHVESAQFMGLKSAAATAILIDIPLTLIDSELRDIEFSAEAHMLERPG
jgi:hypothetical protein